eukprot:TRINITY_DN32093_c0_g1_i1.p2 TRINITY_DN32093_c0_g1~~TRINITY_DN32093_c0_g1_i1.p2  ORF type:complete len:146 (+),score=19.09 TRINITY_DN32093_c0_g1_i1:1012-1449(+)
MESTPAREAMRSGLNVQPPWASSAKIFAEGVGPEHFFPVQPDGEKLTACHVVALESDLVEIQEALEEVPKRDKRYEVKQRRQIRCQKGGGDVLPGDLSLLDVSDEGEHEIENDAVEVVEYRIVGTFITFGPSAGVRRGLSSSASV